MSDEQSGIKITNLGDIPSTATPVSEVEAKDAGSLSLRYEDGVARLVVSGGTALPVKLLVVDETGSRVAAYTAEQPTRARSASIPMGVSADDTAALPEYGGTKVEIDDNELFIYREHDVLARLEKN
ncbi:co-chaperone GroES family protein [Streptomyces sp. NBC_00237]|uniref:co-chaperone GroES family protein n=1 Tax=Streptomyces sp. NBC_00237 TaxID=2975687 RepID=UPI00224DF31B|nr:co-chaperone GroES family protein [Streptomyces sp. NBC_00237]MCX5207643.1 co-chaperone GroES family protein [Streptomyces sp. NBC_00237]